MTLIENPDLRFRKLWLVVGYALIGLVVYLSLTSSPLDPGPDFPFKDKFFHVLAYFSLMFWFAQIYHIRLQRDLWALFFVTLGLLLEYIQSFNPAREGGVGDAVANTLGVVIGLLLARAALKNLLGRFESLL